MKNNVMVIFQRFRHLFREGLWIVVGQVMLVIGSLLGVRLLTGLLDPTAYGELALAMTLATLVNQTALGPLAQGVMRFYAPAVEQGNLGGKEATPIASHGHPYSACLTLPPLAVVFFRHVGIQ